jgi:dihydroorotate dehydrogenase electron transfer subunit
VSAQRLELGHDEPARPVQVTGEVLTTRRAGAYVVLTLVAPGVAERAQPGQFVALAVGGPDSALLLRRAFSICRMQQRGVFGGTFEILFAVRGRGTGWLAERRVHDPVDIVGPLGRPFELPGTAASCALVGGGYGSAPLFALADRLRDRGCRLDFVLGAASESRLFGPLEAKRVAASVTVTTEDGTAGRRGRVSDVLPDVLRRGRSEAVYACGPMGMLAAVTAQGRAYGAHVQTAVEETMACGIGICMTCVLPVRGEDGRTRMLRSCVDGPVFAGERVRWDALGSVPGDAVGAGGPGRM